MKNKKVLVTGGCGFIGSHIVDRLIKDGAKVKVIDDLSTGSLENLNKSAEFHKCDIKNVASLAEHFKGIDYVFHTAALARIQPSIKDPKTTFDANATGTLNVLVAARDAGVKRVIYSASSSVYGEQPSLPLRENMVVHPKNIYALSKLIGEDLCKIFSSLYNLDTVSLRYFNVYGPRQINSGAYSTVIGVFLTQLKNRQPLTITGDGTIRRDFTYIDDVVEANILAAQNKESMEGEIINIGTGKYYSINEVATMVLKIPSSSSEKAMKEKLLTYIPPRPAESRATLASNSKAKKILGWTPKVSFERGLELTRAYY